MSETPIELDDNTDTLPDGWRRVALGEISEATSRTLPDGATLLLSAGDAELWVVPDSDEVVITARSPLLAGKMIVVGGRGSTDGLPDVDPVFLVYWLTDASRDLLLRYAVGRAGLPRITFQRLRDVEVPLPPIDEQRRIASRLRDEFREANEVALRAVQDAVRLYQKDRLRAFAEGKVTESWLESNPAKLAIEESLRPVLNRLRYFAGQHESPEQAMIQDVGAILAKVQSEPMEVATPSEEVESETESPPLAEAPVVTISAGLHSFQLKVDGRPAVSLDGDFYSIFEYFALKIGLDAPGEIVPWASFHKVLGEDTASGLTASKACRKAVSNLRKKLAALGCTRDGRRWLITDKQIGGCRLNTSCEWRLDRVLKRKLGRTQSVDGRWTDARDMAATPDYRNVPEADDA